MIEICVDKYSGVQKYGTKNKIDEVQFMNL